jgi:cobalt-zinc-cadmium efflux system protein
MESAPAHLDMDRVQGALHSIDGLDEVHHIHVWTLTSGLVALSAHGVIDDPTEHTRILQDIREAMSGLGIEHVTFQIEQRPLYHLPGPRASRGRGST